MSMSWVVFIWANARLGVPDPCLHARRDRRETAVAVHASDVTRDRIYVIHGDPTLFGRNALAICDLESFLWGIHADDREAFARRYANHSKAEPTASWNFASLRAVPLHRDGWAAAAASNPQRTVNRSS
jgi:hypothetical protein